MHQTVTPPRKKGRTLGAITNAIVSLSPHQLPLPSVAAVATVTPSGGSDVALLNSFLTWENYIASQSTLRGNLNANPLGSILVLKKILLQRRLIQSPRKSSLYVRQKFEELLESINGPYCSLKITASIMPLPEGRQLLSSQAQFKESVQTWSTKLSCSITPFPPMSATRDVIRTVNVAIEEVALIRSREIEQEHLMKKQAEFAEYFKNHVGNADMHVYGHLTVHRKTYAVEDIVMDDHERNHLASTVYKIVTSHPAAIIPLVHSNATFFLTHLDEMKKVKDTFPLNASLISGLSNIVEAANHTDGAGDDSDGVTPTIPFLCYCCRTEFRCRNNFLTHIKEHEPVTRQSTDDFHEHNFSMKVPTAKNITCEEAVKLFRQGNECAPPALLWSKKSRQNKRLFYIMKELDEKYDLDGHDAFVTNMQGMKASDYVKKM